jgi:hypothetical protein
MSQTGASTYSSASNNKNCKRNRTNSGILGRPLSFHVELVFFPLMNCWKVNYI